MLIRAGNSSFFRHLVICTVAFGVLAKTGCLLAEPASAVLLPHTQKAALASQITGRTYQISINLPEDYETSGKSYPVLYVLDGDWNFALLYGIQDSLGYAKRLPAFITVAIDYGVSYGETLKLRMNDFTPTDWVKKPGSGGAPRYLEFLEKELVPFIEKNYRANPLDRALLGHSYGGLFAVYAWLERPALFQRIVAASPSLDWDDGLLRRRAGEILSKSVSAARLDLSIGSEEDAAGVAELKRFASLLEEFPGQDGKWRCTVYPGEVHTSVKPLSFSQGLTWVYRP